jgi:Retrotransposon gag protein
MAVPLTPEQQAQLVRQAQEAQNRTDILKAENDAIRLQMSGLAEQLSALNARFEGEDLPAGGEQTSATKLGGFSYKPKIPEPPHFDGKTRLDVWEAAMRQYLEVLGMAATAAGAQIASFYLRGPMQRVYTLHKEDVAANRVIPLGSFNDMMALLRAHRPEPDHYRAARENLEMLRQGKSPLDRYCTSFLALWQDVRGFMSEADGVWNFTRGLERELQLESTKPPREATGWRRPSPPPTTMMRCFTPVGAPPVSTLA